MTQHNLREIRILLNDAFNLEELLAIAQEYDEFRPVYDDYPDVKKSEFIRQLIDHSRRKKYFPLLLSIVKEQAPNSYEDYRATSGKPGTQATDASMVLPSLQDSAALFNAIESTRTLWNQKKRILEKLELQKAQASIGLSSAQLDVQIDDLKDELEELELKYDELVQQYEEGRTT